MTAVASLHRLALKPFRTALRTQKTQALIILEISNRIRQHGARLPQTGFASTLGPAALRSAITRLGVTSKEASPTWHTSVTSSPRESPSSRGKGNLFSLQNKGPPEVRLKKINLPIRENTSSLMQFRCHEWFKHLEGTGGGEGPAPGAPIWGVMRGNGTAQVTQGHISDQAQHRRPREVPAAPAVPRGSTQRRAMCCSVLAPGRRAGPRHGCHKPCPAFLGGTRVAGGMIAMPPQSFE